MVIKTKTITSLVNPNSLITKTKLGLEFLLN